MNNQPMNFMQMPAMQKSNQPQMMQQLLQAALARGAPQAAPAAPAGPAAGAVMPGGAMNITPPAVGGAGQGMGGIMSMMGNNPAGMGMLAQLFKRMQPAQQGAPIAEPMSSGNAIY